ncbi:unnamed protein product [Rotaria sp. Silwood2]|nr:unnamed protein product [Rotaria sp. Silwood2]
MNTTNTSQKSSDNEYRKLIQGIRTTDLKVNLVDCMKCCVKIPRCKFEEQGLGSNRHSPTSLDHEIQEHREKQEMASQIQTNQALSTIVEQNEEEEEEEEIYAPLDYLDDYNPMNTLIIIDLPWPQASE